MYILYNIIFFIISIIYIPILFINRLKGKYKSGFKEKFALFTEETINLLHSKPVIWIQAASVGEVMAAEPLINELNEKFSEHKILVSTMTETGRETAHKINAEIDKIVYFPLDLIWIVKKALKLIDPELVILIETELWPNFIRVAKRRDAKVMVASGRISDNSFKSYKYLKAIMKKVLAKVDYFSMQSKLDRDRIVKLGAPADNVSVEGNIKFDRMFNNEGEKKVNIKEKFKIRENQPVVVAGSTHKDEEDRLISVYRQLKERYPGLVFLIAPRYIKRSEKIKKTYERKGINCVLRTNIDKREAGEDVIIVNTIGELAALYKIADLVFVGGSLIEQGGHNILEPAAQQCAVFFGPHMFNFKEDTNYLLENEAAIQVNSKEELSNRMISLLDNRERLKRISKNASTLIKKNRGASKKNARIAKKLLTDKNKKKILLIRLSAIGDVIHALPIARAVRNNYPEAELNWIVEKKAISLVKLNPYLDNVILLPKSKWSKNFKEEKISTLKELKKFFSEFKKNDFDLTLDVHGLFKSGITCYFSGADKKYGPADGREGSKLFYTDKITPPEEKVHQVERNLKLAKGIGAEVDEIDYGLVIPEKVKKDVNRLAKEMGFAGKQTVVINPFTTWESKDWLKERYAELSDRLINDYNYEIVFTGGPADKKGVEKIRDMMEEKGAFNLAGKTNLQELAALYKNSEIFIGGDTGPMHLAVAVATPVIALMGPTDPQTHGPYGEDSKVIQVDIKCKNCWDRKCKKNRHYCMEMIEVDDIIETFVKIKEDKKSL